MTAKKDIAALKHQLRENPHDEAGWLKLLALLRESGQDEQSYPLAKKAYNRNPASLKIGIIYANTSTQRGKIKKAIEVLTLLQHSYPRNYKVALSLARCHHKVSQAKRAQQQFIRAMELAKSEEMKLGAMTELALSYKSGKHTNKSRLVLDEILSIQPEYRKARLLLADISLQAKQLKKAKNEYASVLSDNPEDERAILGLSQVYMEAGKIEDAEKLIKRGLNHNSKNVFFLLALGQLTFDDARYKESINAYEQVLNVNQEHLGALTSIAQIYGRLGQYSKAIKILDSHEDQKQQRILAKKIELFLRWGRERKALRLIKEALVIHPQDVQLHFLHSRCKEQLGLPKQALKVLDQLSPTTDSIKLRILQKKADIFFKNYEYQKSIEITEEILAQGSNKLSNRIKLAQLYVQEYRHDEAMAQLKSATEELVKGSGSRKTQVPLKSHIRYILNDIQSYPSLKNKMDKIMKKEGMDRIHKLAKLVKEDPSYLGSALYLLKEGRDQGLMNRNSRKTSRVIPANIVQYWDASEVPVEITRISKTWQNKHPDFEYTLFNYETALKFLRDNYGIESERAFKNCQGPAEQADYFRLAYLNIHGGIYADADDVCVSSIHPLLEGGYSFIAKQESLSSIGNNFLCAIPQHPIIRSAFNHAHRNLLSYTAENAWFKTGPAILTVATAEHIAQLILSRKLTNNSTLILSLYELKKYVKEHMQLSYKTTDQGWFSRAYNRRVTTSLK